MGSNVTSFSRLAPRTRTAGFSIPEFLIAAAICALVIGQVCALWLFSSRSFATQMNYVTMDQASQRALDLLTREIRQVKTLTSFATNEVIFTDIDDQPLKFAFVNKKLVRTKALQSQVLLENCETGSFAIYQRNPKEGVYEYYPASSPATGKLIEVRWICRKSSLPVGPAATAGVQSAKIVLRSHGS